MKRFKEDTSYVTTRYYFNVVGGRNFYPPRDQYKIFQLWLFRPGEYPRAQAIIRSGFLYTTSCAIETKYILVILKEKTGTFLAPSPLSAGKKIEKKMNFEINCKIDQNNPFRQLFFDGLFLLNFYRRQLFAAEQDIKWQCKRSYMFGRKINSKPF